MSGVQRRQPTGVAYKPTGVAYNQYPPTTGPANYQQAPHFPPPPQQAFRGQSFSPPPRNGRTPTGQAQGVFPQPPVEMTPRQLEQGDGALPPEARATLRKFNALPAKTRQEILNSLNSFLDYPNKLKVKAQPFLTNKTYKLPFALLGSAATIGVVWPLVNSLVIGTVSRVQQNQINKLTNDEFFTVGKGLGAIAGVVANQCQQNNNAWDYCQDARDWAESNLPNFSYQSSATKRGDSALPADNLVYGLDLTPAKVPSEAKQPENA